MALRLFSLLALFGYVFAQKDLVSVLKSQDDLSTLLTAIGLVPGLAGTLNSASDITIFAPTNAAFSALEAGTPEAEAVQSQNPDAVAALLSYHVAKGKYLSSAIAEVPTFVHTLLTSKNKFEGAAATAVTGGQNVGVVLAGDNVEVLSGELQTSTVTEADIQVNGIVVHKIDKVLKIPRVPSETAEDFGLTAIVGALTATKLAPTVDAAPDLTVFIPANAAFEAIGSIVANASIKTLQAVLKYHVIAGSVVFSSDIKNEMVKSYEGEELTLSVVDGAIFVDTAQVVIPNILLSNGVGHVIDSVLNPGAGPVDRGSLDPAAKPSPAFAGASSASVVPFASAAPPPSTTVSIPVIATSAPAVASEAPSASSTSPATANAGAMPTFRAGEAMLGLGVGVVAAFAL